MLHTLAVITVTYNNYTILKDFFASFDKQTNTDFTIFNIDLSDTKKNYLYPAYVIPLVEKNKGYAYGVNKAIQVAISQGYEYFCVMNNDTVVKNDFIEKVILSIKKHPGSLIGGKIYYMAGHEFHKDRYKKKNLGNVLWYAGGINDWDNCMTKHRGVDQIDTGKYEKFQKTSFITGCLMCYDKKTIDVLGHWDEKYFLYYEDADYCERAKKNNLSLYYDPSIVIWHKNAASTHGSGSLLHEQYQRKNQLRFGIKYAPYKTKLHLMKNYISYYLSTICQCDQ